MKKFDNFEQFTNFISKCYPKGERPDWEYCKFEPNGFDRWAWPLISDITTFWWMYYEKYPHDFLVEKAKYIKSPFHKEWVEYCIDRQPYLIRHHNEDFQNDLEILAEDLNLNYDHVFNMLKSGMPYITLGTYFKFAYDNWNSSKLDFFYLLLIIWFNNGGPDLPVSCPIPEYNLNLNEEMCEFQRKYLRWFIENAPNPLKEGCTKVLFDAFKKINSFNIYEVKFSLSYDKVLYGGKVPLDGDFFLPWNKVDFYDGFFYIFHPSFPNGGVGHAPYRVEDKKCRKVFNDIKSYFLKKLPPIRVRASKGRIVEVYNLANLSEYINVMEHKILDIKVESKPVTTIGSAPKEVTGAEARILVKELKSRYLDFLCTRQLDDYKVTCFIENRINSNLAVGIEYAFIFTIKESYGVTYIAYENSKDSRCTYIFPVPKRDWKRSVDIIYEFFASNEVNKRQSLSRRLIDLKLPGNYEYKRIFHTNYFEWSDKIKFC